LRLQRERGNRRRNFRKKIRLLLMKDFLVKYKKPLLIIPSVVILQLIFGFDPKFCIINIIWLFA
jgi:hypothetical protein